jgi:hypothetical protein
MTPQSTGNDQSNSNTPTMMILIGLIATSWIVISLLGVAVCHAAGVADRQQQKTSFPGRPRTIWLFVSNAARSRPAIKV